MSLWHRMSKILRLGAIPLFVAVAFGATQAAAQFSPELPPVEVTLNVGDTILTVEGRTAPNAFVTILENSNPIGTTTANGSGNFSKTFTSQTPGLHTISVYAQVDGVLTDTVTRTINLVAQAETTVNFFLPSTLTLSSNSVTQGQNITLAGRTIPSGTVTITIDNNLIFTTTANTNGQWDYTVNTDGFSIGEHNVYVVVNDGFGNYSSPTTKQVFQVLALLPEVPGLSLGPPTFIQPPSITSPKNNQHFSKSPITIKGIALANSQIEIWDGDKIVGSVFANHLGQWHFVFDLTKPKHVIKARACIQEVCSEFSETITIFFDGAGEQPGLFLTLDQYRYPDVIIADPIDLGINFGGGVEPYELVVDWGDETVERFDATNTELDLQHAYDNPGQFTGIVTVKDTEDEVRMAYFSVLVSEGPKSFLTMQTIVIIAIAATGTATLFIASRAHWLRYLARLKWLFKK